MKISVIGAGNVGGLVAMRLVQEGFGEVVLFDIVKGLAQGKVFDLQDASCVLKHSYRIQGTDDIREIKDSDIVVITAGLPRRPGMSREDLLNKNAKIIKDICLDIKKLAPESMVVVVTNPLDLMTYLALKITGFKPNKVCGMGASLDAARFNNLISREFNIPNADIQACVIGSHGEGMLPLPRFTYVRGVTLNKFTEEQKVEDLVKKTIERGAQIVSLLDSGSAYFAPSAAIAVIVNSIARDAKCTLGVSVYLNGEYGIRDICISVPCRLGREGIEKIVELDLNEEEESAFLNSANSLEKQINHLPR